MEQKYSEWKREVVAAAKKAYKQKLMAGTSGNMSILLSGRTPHSDYTQRL